MQLHIELQLDSLFVPDKSGNEFSEFCLWGRDSEMLFLLGGLFPNTYYARQNIPDLKIHIVDWPERPLGSIAFTTAPRCSHLPNSSCLEYSLPSQESEAESQRSWVCREHTSSGCGSVVYPPDFLASTSMLFAACTWGQTGGSNQAVFTEGFSHVPAWPSHFVWANSNSWAFREALSLFSFYRWGKWGSQRRETFPSSHSRWAWLKAHALNCYDVWPLGSLW